jgi:hypothetical protein
MNGEPVFAALPPGAAIRTDPSVGFNWDPGLLSPSAGRIAGGHGPRFRDRVEGVGWRYRPEFAYRKAWRCPPWVPLPER